MRRCEGLGLVMLQLLLLHFETSCHAIHRLFVKPIELPEWDPDQFDPHPTL
jgi:hypothetical protein